MIPQVHKTEDHAAEKDRAMEVAEAAREAEWSKPSFVAGLFMGNFKPRLIHPYPMQNPEDRKIGDEFCARLEAFLVKNLDPDKVDSSREVPASVLKGLAELGCFAIKIHKEYGGLGMSQTNYNRAIALVASYCGSTAVWLSAHQSIGVPQPLKLFGTEEQKKKFLPRFAKGEISAFALTEPDVGSDPAKMTTFAEPSADGKTYKLNGRKLWCTNGPVADVIVVMAKTPSIVLRGKERPQITAFIVETKNPGFKVLHRCDFMGIRGIQNGLLEFKDMVIPAENIIWGPGKGLKLALTTLNTGRLTLPAASAGIGKQCLWIARTWGQERVQWGAPVGRHDHGAGKIASIASDTFAMEAVTWLSSALADRGDTDIRLEAAMAKLFCSEAAWKAVDQTVQLRGGRGYETGPSLKARGEKGIPTERIMRDTRINMIIEGTSEVMRLFIAREALDRHMRVAGDLIKPGVPLGAKLKALVRTGLFYAWWYPSTFIAWGWWPRFLGAGSLATHLRFVSRNSRRLARAVFHSMVRFGPGLERKQRVLGRLVDVGVELFAMSACVSRARALVRENPSDRSPLELADLYCRGARRRVYHSFCELSWNDDAAGYKLAKKILDGELGWLEEGIIKA